MIDSESNRNCKQILKFIGEKCQSICNHLGRGDAKTSKNWIPDAVALDIVLQIVRFCVTPKDTLAQPMALFVLPMAKTPHEKLLRHALWVQALTAPPYQCEDAPTSPCS